MSRGINEFYYEERNAGEITFDRKVWVKDNKYKNEVTTFRGNVKLDTLGTISDGSSNVTKYRIQNKNESAAEMTGTVGNF